VNLRLVSASNRRAEVEAVARDMLNNARTHGWRFRQMALVLRDLDIYHDLVSAVFSRSGIPFFIDHRRALTHHPLVELVRSALNAACSNLRQEDVFHMLKTDFFDLTRSAVDKLENYVLAHGITARTGLRKTRGLGAWIWRWTGKRLKKTKTSMT
jgi:ATP-dependent helicase/nuclease subunit B